MSDGPQSRNRIVTFDGRAGRWRGGCNARSDMNWRAVSFVVLLAVPASGCLLMGPGDGAPCETPARIDVTPASDCLGVEDYRGEPDCGVFAVRIRNGCSSELILGSPRPGWAARVAPGAAESFDLGGPTAEIGATLGGTPVVIRYDAQ